MDSSTPQTSPEHLHRQLAQLKNQNAPKKTEISQLRQRIEKTIAERDALNAKVKEVSTEVRRLREKRDSLNARVKELKTQRDDLRKMASRKRETLSKLLEQARQISERLPGSMSELTRQIQRLEWYVQTNPLAPQTERNIIAKISTLEAALAKHKGLRNVRDRLLELKVEVGALRIRAQTTHEQLTKLAEESEQVHKEMRELIKVLDEKKKEADTKHGQYLEESGQRREAIDSLRTNMMRIEQIRAQIGAAKASKAEKAEKLKSKYKEAANEKLRTGRKLSFEEFQALMGDTLSEDDEE